MPPVSVAKKIGPQGNERDFVFTMLPATKAVRVEVAIARVIGEPLFRAFMDSQKTGMTPEAQIDAASAAVGVLTSRMDADELLKTQLLVFASVSCNGIAIASEDLVDSIFAGRHRELWEVFIEALKVNFSDFLPASGSPLFQKFQSTSTPSSPPTSTGTGSAP